MDQIVLSISILAAFISLGGIVSILIGIASGKIEV